MRATLAIRGNDPHSTSLLTTGLRYPGGCR
jgi:hypothetical protein